MQIVPPVYLLQTLVVFSEQENLVQTAERLGLTQPTVSRQLQQLEELFDQPLFEQQGRNKVLTPYGQALVKELKPRFSDLERIFQTIDQSFADPKEITVRIGGPKDLLEKFCSDLTFAGTLELASLEAIEAQARLEDKALDIAITDASSDSAELVSKKLLSTTPALAIPKKWAAEIDTARDWSHVCSKHPVAIFSSDKPLLSDFEEKFKVETETNFIFDAWTSIEKRIHQQKSWGILPANYLQENHGYKIIPLTGVFESENYYLSYRKELSKFGWMKDLIAEII